MHDPTVDRTTDGQGSIATNTLANLKLLDAGLWFSSVFAGERIPTLEETITNILPLATPLIDWKAVIAICRALPRDIVFSVECGTVEQAAASIAYLKPLIA
jgi:hypothetical protein